MDSKPIGPISVKLNENLESDKTDFRSRLKEIIIDKSLKIAPTDQPFVLTSGLTSTYYINGKKTTCHPEGLYCLARLLIQYIKDLDIDAIGGPTLGADPMVSAVSLLSYLMGRSIPLFIVRKEAKKHGTHSQVEGIDISGKRVVIVEDVITTGGSVLQAIKAVRALDCDIVKVIALVDREQGGKEAFDRVNIPYYPIFTISELLPPDLIQ